MLDALLVGGIRPFVFDPSSTLSGLFMQQNNSPILACQAPVGAVALKLLPLHPEGAMAPWEKGKNRSLPPGKGASPPVTQA